MLSVFKKNQEEEMKNKKEVEARIRLRSFHFIGGNDLL